MLEVTYGPLSAWQKTNCINNSADHTCPNEAVQEANISDGNNSIGVRCCGSRACMDRAADLARVQVRPAK